MEDNRTLSELFLDTNHLFHRYNMAWYGKNFGGIDPKQGQGRILSALRRMNSIGQKELGTVLGVRPQSLGELLQKLEMNGYIERRRSAIDKRSLIIDLTEKGETFQLSKPDYEELFSDLTEYEQVALIRALEKVSAKLELLLSKDNSKPTPTVSTEDDNSTPSASTEDDNSAPSTSTEDDNPAPSTSTEDDNPAPSASTEDDNSAPSASTEDDNSAPSASTEDDKTS